MNHHRYSAEQHRLLVEAENERVHNERMAIAIIITAAGIATLIGLAIVGIAWAATRW
jgi:hypothetical protein